MADVVIADDEFISLLLFRRLVEECGHTVVAEAHSSIETIEAVKKHRPAIVILDIAMEEKESGIEACKAVKKTSPGTSVVFVSGYARTTFDERLKEIDFDGFLEKPVRQRNLQLAFDSLKI